MQKMNRNIQAQTHRSALQNLFHASVQSEIKHLHDELRKIRHEFNKNGVYVSSMHVNAAIRACSDHAQKLVKDTFTNYKRVISPDRRRFTESYLDTCSAELIGLLREEFRNLDQILNQAVGGVARSLSNAGLQDYKSFESSKEIAMQWLQAEIELFHAEVLSNRPSYGSLVRKWFQESTPGVILAVVFAIASLVATVFKILQ
jgi:hypothetical protein